MPPLPEIQPVAKIPLQTQVMANATIETLAVGDIPGLVVKRVKDAEVEFNVLWIVC